MIMTHASFVGVPSVFFFSSSIDLLLNLKEQLVGKNEVVLCVKRGQDSVVALNIILSVG